MAKSLQLDSIQLVNSLHQAPWIVAYVCLLLEELEELKLIFGSTMANIWRMRKLWNTTRRRTQGCHSRPTLVSRLESHLLGICRPNAGKLGPGYRHKNTQASWTYRSHQLHGREQARRRDAGERFGRWLHWSKLDRLFF